MCLAVPARVVERNGDEGLVELGASRVRVSLLMTPEAQVGDFVLVHAGFAIERLDEQEAKETWELLEQVQVDQPDATPPSPTEPE